MTSSTVPPNAIAVIGMAGRFPGSDSVAQFWRNLSTDTELIVDVSEQDLAANQVTERALESHSYIRRAAMMDGIDEFDAEFFGFNNQTARTMDPQHRLFLQTSWHAFEDAGVDPADYDGSIGVFATSSASGYLLHNLMSHMSPASIIGEGATFEMVNLSLHNDKDHIATRVAHQFNLRGPALAVQTACSSSLLAVHLACQSILSGESDMALAGGSSIRVPNQVGYWHQAGAMTSPSGHCRPFDVRADGTIFGSGVGVVLLKPLEDALEDGDRVHAIIRGSAVNNDGSTKMNYAAPNATGQAEVIAEAHAIAEVDASSISYVESHGTGTPLGDPIEIEGLRQAFDLAEEDRQGPCVVGSVKSNIGHLEVASGIASLIKTILCLEHKTLPGTLHYTAPNPELHLDRGPFEIRKATSDWAWDGPRRAGISSFGVGGTNVHMVLEEAPTAATAQPSSSPQVLTLSARTPESLVTARKALATELASDESIDIADVAFTLSGRRRDRFRMAAVVDSRSDAAEVLGADEHDNVFAGEAVSGAAADTDDRVAFLFPGQGAQHIGMAKGLHETEPVFAEHFDRCIELFDAELGIDLRAAIFTGSARDLERTDRTQPALFSVEYALAKLLESRGVRPTALAGHSIGEYAAAAFAGVFDLPSAVKVVSMRARLMNSAPRGVMVAVPLSPADVAPFLSGDVDIATVNEPGGCVVAGTQDAIDDFSDRLEDEGIVARRVRTSHAFHSRLMDGVIPEFTGFLSRITLNEPRIPMLSNVTGTWMSASEATNPATWARQIRATVRFADEVGALLENPARVLVEVGPGGTLTSAAARHPRWSSDHRAVRPMRHHAQNRDDRDAFLLALGQLWAAGVDVDLADAATRTPARITLPGYPFARQKHWLAPNGAAMTGGGTGLPEVGTAAAPSAPGGGGRTSVEATLSRIWAQCLGLESVDRGANFFELGGDSLIAISVAMTATNEGLELTPQDLYENQTVGALSAALSARYASNGLARHTTADVELPPTPPNITAFLDEGIRDGGHWRTPVLLALRSDVRADAVTDVLTALVNHHDALRVSLVERAGIWEQQFGDPIESFDLSTATLPDDVESGTTDERAAALAVLDGQIAGLDLSAAPLAATFITGNGDGSSYLGVSLHGMIADTESRDILLTDLFTAFAQRLADQPIVLAPVATSWHEWSVRCAGLATHPAVLDSREYWLDAVSSPNLRLVYQETERPESADYTRITAGLSTDATVQFEDARRRLGFPIEQFLLTALGRTVAGAVGNGVLRVDLRGQGRSVLKPDIDPRRTVGSFASLYPFALRCEKISGLPVRELIGEVRDQLDAVPHFGVGYGLLHYLYAPTARQLAAVASADVHLDVAGAIPDLSAADSASAPVQFDTDAALATRGAAPGLGHAIEIRAYRSGDELVVDWWFDPRRIEPERAEHLAEEFRTSLIDLVHEAIIEDEAESAGDELELVDLSAPNFDLGPDFELGEAGARH